MKDTENRFSVATSPQIAETHWRTATAVALVFFIAFASIPSDASARARWTRKPASTPLSTPAPAPATTSPAAPPVATTVTSTSGTLCMNLGYQTRVKGTYDWVQIDANFTKLKTSGFTCVRLDYGWFHDANLETLALRGKSNGLYIIIGGTAGTLNPSQLASYDAGVIAQAQWAQQNAMPQMSIGNEQESRLSGMTPMQWVGHLHDLSAQVRKVYSGKISYEINSDDLPLWQQNGLGSIDLLGLNVYCGVGCNSDRIASAIKSFGVSHVFVSESNADMETGLYNSDATHAANVKANFMVLHSTFPNTPLYYFNFLGSGSGQWGLYSGTTLVQPLTAAALGIK